MWLGLVWLSFASTWRFGAWWCHPACTRNTISYCHPPEHLCPRVYGRRPTAPVIAFLQVTSPPPHLLILHGPRAVAIRACSPPVANILNDGKNNFIVLLSLE